MNCTHLTIIVKPATGETYCWDPIDEAPQLADALANGWVTQQPTELAFTGSHTDLLGSLGIILVALGFAAKRVARRFA